MRSSIFQYPYEKVFRRTRRALSHLGLRILDSDESQGSITAETNFSLTNSTVKIDLIVEEMENHDTKVTVTGLLVKKRFFQKNKDLEARESEILETLSQII